jgi:hypothetical protein
MAIMPRLRYSGVCVAVAVALVAALPSSALADATLSRSGNVVTLVSDSDGDNVHNAGTDNRRLITFFVESGRVLRAGPGCERLRGPRVTKVVVACGAPSQNEKVNRVTMNVRLGGGDDRFVPAGVDDVQPRIVADGGPGSDIIFGTTNSDDINGGAGDDQLLGFDDVDNIDGGDGADFIVGGSGDDGLVGGPGRDSIFGDERKSTSAWGNDLITAALDFTPDRLDCGGGDGDLAVVDADDTENTNCENLAGGQSTPPRDVTGTLPLTVSIGRLSSTPDFAHILRGRPIAIPITFSAAAQIAAELKLSAAEAERLGVPGRERVIANDIGTPLVLTPLTLNTQMRLRWPARPYLEDENLIRATLTIVATDTTGATTTASKDVTLRR